MKVTYTNAEDDLFENGLVRLSFDGTEEEIQAFADTLDLVRATA